MSSVGSSEFDSLAAKPGGDPEDGAVEASGEGSNPFERDVCEDLLSAVEEESVDGLHDDALERLAGGLEAPDGRGRVLLLTAPRAGYGKTHLLGRLARGLRGEVTVMPVRFMTGEAFTLATLCQRGMEALREARTERADWTVLREVSAGVVAALVHGLIEGGRLASANQAQALRVLAGPVNEIFDAKGSARPIGDWVRQNREQLRTPMAALATERVSPERPLSPLWVEALLEQAAEGGAAGVAAMHELAATESAGDGTAWIRLAGVARPLVVVLDHVDGLSGDVRAAVRLAALGAELAEVHGLRVVLSVNQDVWQGTFGAHLPSALEDRLTAAQVALRGLTAADAEALVRQRLARAGVAGRAAEEFGQFLAVERFFLGRPVGTVPVRGFLRHAARQWEMFQHSVPPPPEGAEGSPWLKAAEQGRGDQPLIPLMPEVAEGGADEGAEAVPAIFDESTTAYVKDMAEGLTEPPRPGAEPAENSAPMPTATSAVEASDAGAVAPSPDAFEKLREMLGRLRQPAAPEGGAEAAAEEEAAETAVGLMEAPAGTEPAKGTMAPVQAQGTNLLLGRFEALRLQMRAEAEAQPLDLGRLADLIRLAGRRFPLVRFSEPDLPGLAGRQVMCWSLQGVEILFGLAPFGEALYWKALAAFSAGRQAAVDTGTGAKVKMVTFKTDREQAAYQVLMSDVLTEAVAPSVDAVHLDSGSVASLYAMQRIIKEAESGALAVEPAQVMSALARELDFFWRRVTRLG